MKAAIFSDIHANLEALEAVLKDMERRGGVDEVWCLGDIVDYGPEPRECLHLIRDLQGTCIAGNHDLAVAGKLNLIDFPPMVASITRWTASQLEREDKDYLEGLPLTLERGDFTLAHGSPRDPIWEYLLSAKEAEENLKYFKTPYCLIGHSHIPLLFECNNYCSMIELTPDIDPRHIGNWMNFDKFAEKNKPADAEIKLGERRLIINPGGIGQPRDGDPRAAYAIYDSEAQTVTRFRVEYNVSLTQQKMAKIGHPEWLIARLAEGR